MNIKFCKPVIPNFVILESLLSTGFESGQLSNFGDLYHLASVFLRHRLELSADKDILITSSGHTALMAAYKALGVSNVIVPAYTFEATKSAATLQGIDVEVVDVSPKSGCLTVGVLSGVPIASYDAVVAVAALSTIPDLQSLSDFCRDNNKKLIIDGAPTFGTSGIYNFGDAFCLSFHATKTLSVGEAGAVILDKGNYSTAKSFINFGFDDNKNVLFDGINGKISEYSCAVLVDLLDKIDYYIECRIRNYKLYKHLLSDTVSFMDSFVEDTVYCSLPVFFDLEEDANRCVTKLNSNGVSALKYYRPLVPGFTVADDLYSRNVCLPIHHGLTDHDVEYICSLIKSL